MDARLIVLDGRHCGRKIKLPPTQFVIGRDPKCHLRPASRRVSRYHCAIAYRDHAVIVRDLKSQNGTFINGRRLEGTARLVAGDVLQVGGVKFLIEVDLEGGLERPSQPDSGLMWLLEEREAAERAASVPTCDTVLSLDVFDDESSPSASADPPGSNDTLVAGDYLHDYAARCGLKPD